jgi:hypothetical protein
MTQSFANPRTLSAARFELESPRYFWNTPTAAGAASFTMDPNRTRASRSLSAKLRSWGQRLLAGR